MLKDIYFYNFQENFFKKPTDTRLKPIKTATKKVTHKAVEFIGNKIADSLTRSSNDKVVKQERLEEMFYQKKEMKY